jgi:hypothetical protein
VAQWTGDGGAAWLFSSVFFKKRLLSEISQKSCAQLYFDFGAKIRLLPNLSDENLPVAYAARNILLKLKNNFSHPTISPYIWACQRVILSNFSSPTFSSAYRLKLVHQLNFSINLTG